MVSVSPLALPGRGRSKSCYGLRAAPTSQCAVTFPRIQKFLQSCYREIIKTPLLIGNIGEYLVVTTGEYLRKNDKFSLRLTKISFSLNSPRPSELGQIYVEWYTSCKILWLAPPHSVEGVGNCPNSTWGATAVAKRSSPISKGVSQHFLFLSSTAANTPEFGCFGSH